MYLGPASCISFQNTFGDDLPWQELTTVSAEMALVQPDYKQFVSPAAMRRMSSALKMGVAGGKNCLAKAGMTDVDAISVGTGLGCVRDTLKFLQAIYEDGEGGLSPTAFIQSTHNSIAGQLALVLGNHGYNMTHVQGALSLGYALLDAELLLAEGDAASVLVGTVDERTDELVLLLTRLAEANGTQLPQIGEGAAFFLATKEATEHSVARLIGLSMTGLERVQDAHPQADLVFSNTDEGFNYTRFSGEHFSSPGFGLFMALKAFEAGSITSPHLSFDHPDRILVRHGLFGKELCILLEKV